MLKWAKYAKQKKDHDRERERQEYIENMNLEAQRQKNKQDALAEYYRQLDAQMKGNYEAHQKMAYLPQQEKLAKLNGIEDKNQRDFLKRQAQGDDASNLNRLKNNQILVAENDKMLKKKKFDEELERMKRAEDELNAKGQNTAFQIGKELDLEEEKERKNIYKQTLLYQQAMNEHNKHNFGKMTFAEKRLNKHDLKAYREKKPMIYSLAPGVNTIQSVGATAYPKGKGVSAIEGQGPLTARYSMTHSNELARPQANSTYKGLTSHQSMVQFPDGASIQDSRAAFNRSNRRNSVLRASAQNSLQL